MILPTGIEYNIRLSLMLWYTNIASYCFLAPACHPGSSSSQEGSVMSTSIVNLVVYLKDLSEIVFNNCG